MILLKKLFCRSGIFGGQSSLRSGGVIDCQHRAAAQPQKQKAAAGRQRLTQRHSAADPQPKQKKTTNHTARKEVNPSDGIFQGKRI